MATNLNNNKPINPCYASEAAFKAHELGYIKSYLRDKIDSYYNKLHLDHGITGHMIGIYAYGPNTEHLAITYAENHDGGHPIYDIISEHVIPDYSTYTPDQIYADWQGSL